MNISTIKKLFKLTILSILCLSVNITYAQNKSKLEKNKIYTSDLIDLETSKCNNLIDKSEILEKEFPNNKFSLDLNKNILFITDINKENSKEIKFSLDNSKMIFKDQEEYGKLEAYLIFINDLPTLKFKDHLDDCFFFVVNFTK